MPSCTVSRLTLGVTTWCTVNRNIAPLHVAVSRKASAPGFPAIDALNTVGVAVVVVTVMFDATAFKNDIVRLLGAVTTTEAAIKVMVWSKASATTVSWTPVTQRGEAMSAAYVHWPRPAMPPVTFREYRTLRLNEATVTCSREMVKMCAPSHLAAAILHAENSIHPV